MCAAYAPHSVGPRLPPPGSTLWEKMSLADQSSFIINFFEPMKRLSCECLQVGRKAHTNSSSGAGSPHWPSAALRHWAGSAELPVQGGAGGECSGPWSPASDNVLAMDASGGSSGPKKDEEMNPPHQVCVQYIILVIYYLHVVLNTISNGFVFVCKYTVYGV